MFSHSETQQKFAKFYVKINDPTSNAQLLYR